MLQTTIETSNANTIVGSSVDRLTRRSASFTDPESPAAEHNVRGSRSTKVRSVKALDKATGQHIVTKNANYPSKKAR
jgi:hypothetical protein